MYNGYLANAINTSNQKVNTKGQLGSMYVPSLLKELNNNKSYISYSKKKNSKNYGDPYGFPSNYPSKSAMVNSFAPVAVNLGPVNW